MCDFEEQIRKIIDVLNIALQCSERSLNQSEYALKIEKALGNLNITALLGGVAKPPSPTPRAALMGRGIFKMIVPAYNNLTTTDSTPVSTTILHAFNSTAPTGTFSAVPVPTTTPSVSPMLKLHRLELIKVGVLVIVISIILVTTCRMVFQLFLRFRPEKST